VSHQTVDPVAVGNDRPLRGNDAGVQWEKATAKQKQTFCGDEAKADKSLDSSGFSNSRKDKSLTPEKLCTELDSYYSTKGTGDKTTPLRQAVRFVLLTLSK
jgi:hypothetical protein